MGPHWKEGFHRGGSYGLQTSQGSNLMFCFLLYYVVDKQSHVPTVIEMNHPAIMAQRVVSTQMVNLKESFLSRHFSSVTYFDPSNE